MINAELDPANSTKIILDGAYTYKNKITTIPGASFSSKDNIWRVPLSWQACLALRATFRGDLQIGPNLVAWASNHRKTKIDPAMAIRNSLEGSGYDGLFPHQKVDVEFLNLARRAMLNNEVGTGKTRAAVSTIKKIAESGENPYPVLVVGPKSVLIPWEREIHAILPDAKVQIISGTATQRKRAIKEEADFYITNYESLSSHSSLKAYAGAPPLVRCKACGGMDSKVTETKCQTHKREFNDIEFGAIIVDEAHRVGNPASQMTRALWSLSEGTDTRIAMTGTPIRNDVSEIWAILHWLYPNAYPGITIFRERFLEMAFNFWGGQEVVGFLPGRESEFRAGFEPIMRHVPKAAVLTNLPPVTKEVRYVEMTPKQKTAYKQMKEDMIALLEHEDGTSNVLLAQSDLMKTLRLHQLASAYGEVVQEEKWELNLSTNLPEKRVVEKFVMSGPSSKVAAFMDDIEDFGEESVIVFSASRQLLALLEAKLEAAKISYGLIVGGQSAIDRQFNIDNFQQGKVQFILVTTQAGGTGITLTRASIAAYLSNTWSLVDREQSEGRFHRPGSEIHTSIKIIDYIAPDTIDEVVVEGLASKNKNLQEILRSREILLKALKNGVLKDDSSD